MIGIYIVCYITFYGYRLTSIFIVSSFLFEYFDSGDLFTQFFCLISQIAYVFELQKHKCACNISTANQIYFYKGIIYDFIAFKSKSQMDIYTVNVWWIVLQSQFDMFFNMKCFKLLLIFQSKLIKVLIKGFRI